MILGGGCTVLSLTICTAQVQFKQVFHHKLSEDTSSPSVYSATRVTEPCLGPDSPSHPEEGNSRGIHLILLLGTKSRNCPTPGFHIQQSPGLPAWGWAQPCSASGGPQIRGQGSISKGAGTQLCVLFTCTWIEMNVFPWQPPEHTQPGC